MKTKQAKITVSASQLPGILIEKYTYSAGAIEPLPKHSHQEYQLGISFNCQGEYFYRGAYHPIPIGNLSIIHSGEVHSPSDRTYLPQPATLAATATGFYDQSHFGHHFKRLVGTTPRNYRISSESSN